MADARFAELVSSPDTKLRPFKKIYPAKKTKAPIKPTYQSEETYNKEIADESGYLLLDQRLVAMDDVPGPGIEACDLIDLKKRRFIHVKKSSRQSSVLSHLFKQGGNSAQLLKKYPKFQTELSAVVKKHYGGDTAKELISSFEKKWTVEFQVADFPRANGQHNIPFFSKLSLREEASNIGAMGFGVRIGFITLARLE